MERGLQALVFSEQAKYVYIGRDGRDVAWSMYNHHANANQGWYDALNNTPGRVGPPIEEPPDTVTPFYHEWFERDGPLWSQPGHNMPTSKMLTQYFVDYVEGTCK